MRMLNIALVIALSGCAYHQDKDSDIPRSNEAVLLEPFTLSANSDHTRTSTIDDRHFKWIERGSYTEFHLVPGIHVVEGIATKGGFNERYRISRLFEAGKHYQYVTEFSGYSLTVRIEETPR